LGIFMANVVLFPPSLCNFTHAANCPWPSIRDATKQAT
jgi:hypothetical protein